MVQCQTRCLTFAVLANVKITSDRQHEISFHDQPINNEPLLSQWTTKLRRDPAYFNVTVHTKICSAHFPSEDFIDLAAKKRRVYKEAVNFIFAWTKGMNKKIKETREVSQE